MSDDVLLAIDQGTSSSRAMAFAPSGETVAAEQQAFEQIYPAPGWWSTTRSDLGHGAFDDPTGAAPIGRAAGRRRRHRITNQRETTVLWDKRDGVPLFNAIVWQDRRTADRCRTSIAAARGGTHAKDRPAAGPLFFGHQDCLDPGSRAGVRAMPPLRGTSLSGRWTVS